MNIMISGSNGLIGKNLKKSLIASGHEVTGLSRDFSKPINFEGDIIIINSYAHINHESVYKFKPKLLIFD